MRNIGGQFLKRSVYKIAVWVSCSAKFHAVCKSDGYPADGSDEDNSYAKFSPSAELTINVQNPALKGQFKPGQKFYVDFTAADPEPAPAG